MKIHQHVGVVSAVDEATLREALAHAALQHRVLSWVAENACVLEREDAKTLAEALEKINFHPKVIENA